MVETDIERFNEYATEYLISLGLEATEAALSSFKAQYRRNPFPDFDKFLKNKTQSNEENIKNLQKDALQLLAARMPNDSTEAAVEGILKKWNLVTIRDDNANDEMYIYKEGIYVPNAKTYVAEFVKDTYGKAYGRDLLSKIIAKIVVRTYVAATDFFNSAPINLLPVKNGIIDLTTKELLPFTPTIYFLSKLPVEYKPEADCQDIKKFYNEVLRDKEDVKVVQEFFGFLLERDYKYQVTFMCLGNGSNGKSKHLGLIKLFLGEENCTSITLQDLERDQYAKSNLFGKYANIAGDISKAPIEDSSEFKSLSGGDLITANRKHLIHINFSNYAKLIYSANELPPTYDLTEGFFRRWKILDFPHKFYKANEWLALPPEVQITAKLADLDILNKLSTPNELSGLLNWALEGLDRLTANKDFSNSKSIGEIEMNWMRKSNSFFAFLYDEMELETKSHVLKSDLRTIYVDYCNYFKLEPVSDKVIKITLEKRGVSEMRIRVKEEGRDYGERENVWHGIKFKAEKIRTDLINPSLSLPIRTYPVRGGQAGSHFSKSTHEDIYKSISSESGERADRGGQDTETGLESSHNLLELFRKMFLLNNHKEFSTDELVEKCEKITYEWLKHMEEKGDVLQIRPDFWIPF